MTVALFFIENACYKGFQISGHSGYAPEGKDIVCAAVTSAVRLTECILTDVLELDTKTTTDERLAAVKITINGNPEKAQSIVKGLRLHLMALSQEYSDYLKVLEV